MSNLCAAEFRGPGVRHQFDHDSPDEYELDLDHRSRGYGRSGRIILLGDGTEVLTDSDDTEMFEHSEEDKDAPNQVNKAGSDTSAEDSTARKEREDTPGPQSATSDAPTSKATGSNHQDASHGPSTSIRGIVDEPEEDKDA